jgi:hypothetical protein
MMQIVKEMIEQFVTGIKNRIGPDAFAGKRLRVVFIYNKN